MVTCACGCGGPVAPGKRFVQYHGNRRGAVDYLVEDRGYRTPCWIWQRAMARGKFAQYPQTSRNGKSCGAHRAYYEDRYGPIPAGMTLDHRCRQPACVNPDHQEVVTLTENIRRGGSTKLDLEQVQVIHLHRAAGMRQRVLAAMFDVGPDQISRILGGKRWPEVQAMMKG